MVSSWPYWDAAPELIIPIPLHTKRKKSRGFNQSALLAFRLGQQLNIPVDETSSQTG